MRSVPPVLAVEIAGEDEEERVLQEKARWYLEHAVPVVWLVLHEAREVVVLTPSNEKRFGLADRLDANELLPDLEPEVARLFAQLDRH